MEVVLEVKTFGILQLKFTSVDVPVRYDQTSMLKNVQIKPQGSQKQDLFPFLRSVWYIPNQNIQKKLLYIIPGRLCLSLRRLPQCL